MASLQERRNKEGKLISYSIRVHRGRDAAGKQLSPFTSTFLVPDNWTEARARKAAEKEAVLFEKKCKDGLVGIEKQTFEAYSKYVMGLKEKMLKVRTVDRYRELLERIIPAIGHIKLTDLRPQHLNQFYDNLGEEGQNQKTGGRLSNKTILEHHRVISTILTQAEKELLIPFNPARRATPPKVEKTQANYFQIEDVNRIIENLESEPIKMKTITYLMILSGCRRGEIMGLKWHNIDFANNTIKIESALLRTKSKGVYEDTTKTDKSRKIKLPPEMMQLLKEYKLWYMKERLANGDRWIQSDYVFPGEIGGHMAPDTITQWQRRFAERCSLPHINPHAFRHTFASILLSKGIDIVTVSKTLGHEKVTTTLDIYAEMMKQGSEQASNCIAEALLR